MAKDLKLIWDSELVAGDLGIMNGDLISDEALETAVLISIFTDRRAANDDPLPDSNNIDKRGWWGDLVAFDIEGDEIGSKLWLLSREKTTLETIKKTKQYLDDALAWLVEDGVAVRVDNYVERQGEPGNERLAFHCVVYKTDGRELSYDYNFQWQEV